MKAKPLKLLPITGYVEVVAEDATHIELNFPGPVGTLHLPVQQRGTRKGTGNWTWNGDTEKPTLRPSVLTTMDHKGLRCHTWVTDGQAQFLDDCSHILKGQTVDMLDVT